MSEKFNIIATPLVSVMLVQRLPVADDRGYFERLFCAKEMATCGHPGVIAQINHSLTRKIGTVRGMHFQNPPHGEWKIISCLRGRVHDVIVDLRQGSKSFLKYFSVELSGDSYYSLLVPPGCAHGFQTLTDDCEMIYLHSHSYVPTADAGVRIDDPAVGIQWPLPIAERSLRDAQHPLLPSDYTGLIL